jgi:hypothetical protein
VEHTGDEREQRQSGGGDNGQAGLEGMALNDADKKYVLAKDIALGAGALGTSAFWTGTMGFNASVWSMTGIGRGYPKLANTGGQ